MTTRSRSLRSHDGVCDVTPGWSLLLTRSRATRRGGCGTLFGDQRARCERRPASFCEGCSWCCSVGHLCLCAFDLRSEEEDFEERDREGG